MAFLSAFLCFVAISGYLVAEASSRRVVVTGESVTGISPWSGQRTFKWKEIQSISYSHPSAGYFLTGPAGRKIFVGDYFSGIGELMAELEERVPEEKWGRPG
jgi:hypothetical protein